MAAGAVIVLVMGVVAVDNVGWHIPVEQARDHLDAEKASNKAAHDNEACRVISKAILLQILFRRWKHAVQRRIKLHNIAVD